MTSAIAGRRVWVAGHRGMVGGALTRRLAREDCEVVTVERARLDLRRQADVEDWLAESRPNLIVAAAAKVGGILANDTYPADFLHDNLTIECNIIGAAHHLAVDKLLFLGSSCIYPRAAAQPMTESALFTGALEPTNEWYAVAKLAGIKLCQAYRRQHGRDFISAIPCNLYGPGDNFDLLSSHVVPALIAKAHGAKRARACPRGLGLGKATARVSPPDDAADALVRLLADYSGDAPVNVGSGSDVTIRELATLVCAAVGFDGELLFDPDKPDGMPRKVMDVSRLAALGWRASVGLREGLENTYAWYRRHYAAD